jgi:transposase
MVPDYPRIAVDGVCRYEAYLNRAYCKMAEHFGIAIMPARPYRPSDKAKGENAVLLVAIAFSFNA